MRITTLLFLSLACVNCMSSDEECHSGSLNKLTLPGLLSRANVSDECLREARSEFKRKYGDASFIASGKFINDESNAIQKIGYNFFNIKNFNTIVNILKHFGDLIETLEIAFEQIKSTEGKEIVRYVNDHCYKSLATLKLRNCKENVLNDLKQIFINVKTVTFSSDPLKAVGFATNTLELNVIFPNVQFLYLEYTKNSDRWFIGKKFPHLTLLHVEMPRENAHDRPGDLFVVDLIKSNVQIETLSVRHSSLLVLRAAKQFLSHLKNLQIRLFSENFPKHATDLIRFDTVQLLTIESDRSKNELPNNIICSHLKEITLNVQPEFNSNWLEFIGKQSSESVTRITLRSGFLRNRHLIQIADKLPNLKMISIECNSEIQAQAILNFIDKSKHLKRIDLRVLMEEFEQKELQAKLQNDWDIEYDLVDDNKVKITLLSYFAQEDCIPGSLNKLSLSSLLNKTNISDDCLSEARSVFSKNYDVTILKITGPFSNDDEYAIDETNRKMVEIKNFGTAKAIWSSFGDLIKKFAICFDQIDGNDGKEIISDVNDGRAESTLSSLYIENCRETVLDDLRTEMPFVEHVTFSSSSSSNLQIRADALKLNEIFPNLKSIDLKHTSASDWAYFGDSFPHLNDLRVELPEFGSDQNSISENVLHLLKNNFNISALSIGHSSLQFLKEVNKVVPQLKKLKLETLSKDYLNYDGDAICFETVKFLTIKSDRKDEIPERIAFNHLQELRLNIKPEFTNKWVEFIDKQLNSTVFFELETETLTNAYLLDIAKRLPNLKRADISCEAKVSAPTIIEFLEQSRDLHSLHLDILMNDFEVELLEEEICNRWDINHVTISGNRIKIALERLHEHVNAAASIHSVHVMVIAFIFGTVRLC